MDDESGIEMSQDEIEELAKVMEDLEWGSEVKSPVEMKLIEALRRICWHLSQRP